VKIAKALREIGNLKCLEKAKCLENNLSQTSSLNLRNVELSSSDIDVISVILEEEKIHDSNFITSISFSYNHLIGDTGVMAIVRSLPASIREVGFVNCGIGDKGGSEILIWMKKSPHLQMICMEQNNFSEALKLEFRDFQKKSPNVTVVF
jgi:hypothetical protein